MYKYVVKAVVFSSLVHLVFFVIVPVLSGLLLTCFYVPDVIDAYNNVEHLQNEVRFGFVQRSGNAASIFVPFFPLLCRLFFYSFCDEKEEKKMKTINLPRNDNQHRGNKNPYREEHNGETRKNTTFTVIASTILARPTTKYTDLRKGSRSLVGCLLVMIQRTILLILKLQPNLHRLSLRFVLWICRVFLCK
ncbi:hypothetical protein [Brevibacillus brevis]|uniref:hypothetical protein n=1 Tax=Brevibacillus brevis TaxID=1393 RepID=UPI0037C1933E